MKCVLYCSYLLVVSFKEGFFMLIFLYISKIILSVSSNFEKSVGFIINYKTSLMMKILNQDTTNSS